METGIVAIQSATSWKLTFEAKKFFQSAAKAIIKASAGAYGDAATELPELAAALGLGSRPEERAFLLLFRSLERALLAVTRNILNGEDQSSLDVHAASFVGLSDEFQFEINNDFFEHPERSGIIELISPDALRWLEILGVNEIDSRNVIGRLPSVFARAMHDEYRANPTYYSELTSAVDSPFAAAASFERDWDRYRSYLVSLESEPVFDETFSLAQVYVEPRAYYSVAGATADDGKHFLGTHVSLAEPIKVVRQLTPEIEQWIQSKSKDLTVRAIAGGPGAGKSSYAKLLAARLARQGLQVLFVPLHQVDLESGFSKSLAEFFIEAGHFNDSPLSRLQSERPCVMILDGLDEIQMQGRAAQEAAYNFVHDVVRLVDRTNSIELRLKCLITGRDLAVQSAEGIFKGEGQVLHLLPYYISEGERRTYSDTLDLLAVDQRDEWWERYGRLTGELYSSMPDSLRLGELNDVTAQPLLNYLVALAFRRGLSLGENANINSVYEDLLKAVFARSWAKNNHPSVQNIPYTSFVRLLEEVALAVWHGAGRTTTLAEVEDHCRQSKVAPLLPSFETGASSGVSNLLLAFYFRQKGARSNGDKTFEFTHKSFAEYLTSLGIVRVVSSVSRQLSLFIEDPDAGIDEEGALHKWLVLCGRTAIDQYLLDFIRREVSSKPSGTVEQWQLTLSRMLSASLKSGWPISRIEGIRYTEQSKRIRNAEEALIACLNSCSRALKKQAVVDWPTSVSFGSLLKRVQGQRVGPLNPLIMVCLSHLDLSSQHMDMADFYKADLRFCDLRNSELNYAIMLGAQLDSCDFIGARMSGANITNSSLDNAMFPIRQVTSIIRRRSTEKLLTEDHETRPGSSSRNFVAACKRLSSRGAILVGDDLEPVDSEDFEKYYFEHVK